MRDVALLLLLISILAIPVLAVSQEPSAFFQTPHARVPNFAHPNHAHGRTIITSNSDGNWSSAMIWQPRVPGANDVVIIKHKVKFDSSAQIHSLAIYPSGHLDFARDRNTILSLVNLQVFAGGHLEIGSKTEPLPQAVSATLVFRDVAIPTGTVTNPGTDPEQWGNGLLVLDGKLTMHGALQAPTFARLAQEPTPDASTLYLQTELTGWRAGDAIILPDTRQLEPDESSWRGTYQPQWEVHTIADVDHVSVTLSDILQYDHFGSRNGDGGLALLPHVANLSRNVIVRSENPGGIRGHVLFTHHAAVEVSFVQFQDLGRTTTNPLDDTTFDGNGNLLHIGTNQADRYPLHAFHLYGPTTIPANGHQFTLLGNCINGGHKDHIYKWGIVLSDSHYGLITDNVVFNTAGAGLAMPIASASFNVIEQNFVSVVRGNGQKSITNQIKKQQGSEGAAYWSTAPNNFFRDNVATNVGMLAGSQSVGHGWNVGYAIYPGGKVDIPAFQGANPSAANERINVDMQAMPLLAFVRNEVYGAVKIGMITVHLGWHTASPDAASVISDLQAWHVHDIGYWGHWNNQVELNHFIARGDNFN